MKAYRATFPLAAMCRVLDLSPSGYYDWLKRPPSARTRRDVELQGKILLSWGGSGETYGCPRIHAELQAAGERVSRKRVARLMRDLGIQGVTRRRFKTATTKKDAKARPAPDLVNRNFSADGPEPAVGRRHHAGEHLEWLAVPRGRARCLEPPHRRWRWRRTCGPNWWRARWRWRSRTGSPRGGWCITRIKARSIRRWPSEALPRGRRGAVDGLGGRRLR